MEAVKQGSICLGLRSDDYAVCLKINTIYKLKKIFSK
jgi:hypothetical protein